MDLQVESELCSGSGSVERGWLRNGRDKRDIASSEIRMSTEKECIYFPKP